MPHMPQPGKGDSPSGLVCGFFAILLWSFSALFICLGADSIGAWEFLFVATLVGGTGQTLFRWATRGGLRRALYLPGRLWLLTLFAFVFYVVSYALALAGVKTDAQRCAVNLINYLWPTLTVICGVLLAGSGRFSGGLILGIVCAFSGTLLANLDRVKSAFGSGAWSGGEEAGVAYYALALAAALAWAVYSSLLSRWRDWAKEYSCSAAGLLIVALIALIMEIGTGGWTAHLQTKGLVLSALAGAGPFFGGYMLWDLALARANVKTLGFMGAVTPILSTSWLCLFLHYAPSYGLAAGAALISGAIVLSLRS